MDAITLGRTGLQATVMGLGAGGHSRIGQSTGKSKAESVAIVRQALEAGINFLDSSEAYGTEEMVGQGMRGFDRSSLIVSTKKRITQQMTAQDVRQGLEASLKRLGTDYVDIYHLHGVRLEEYDHLLAEAVPAMQALRDEGKIRFIGITEHFSSDTRHAMLQRALQDDVWDVMMVGFNILNQSARWLVFPQTIEKNIGVLVMFAVRRALHDPQNLREVIQGLVASGQMDPSEVDLDDPLGFLVHEGSAASIPDAAYRFARFEPGTHVILSGTGNPDHLKVNLASFYRPPLSEQSRRRLEHMFRNVDSVSGN